MKKRRRRSASPETGMFTNFLVNHFTAAGVSYIVTSQPSWKRWIWFVALWVIFLGMGYMTLQVIQEYRKYPTTYKTVRKSATVLDFPAVTVCGLNLIPKLNARLADVQYLIDMKETLFKLEKYNVTFAEKKKCRDHPLCYWSWTLNQCQCVASPCDTALCSPHDEDDDADTCVCAMLICNLDDAEMEGACIPPYGELKQMEEDCICKKNFRYPRVTNISRPKRPPDPPFESENEFDADPMATMRETRKQCRSIDDTNRERCEMRKALMSNGFDERGANLINLIRSSLNDDLQDIRRFFQPSFSGSSAYGNTFDNLILSCSFGHEECNRKNFSTLFSPTYGKCYMFNYIGSDDDRTPVVVRHAGRANGLQLYLQTRKPDMIDLLNPQIGMRIIVHDSHMLPFATEHGIDIRPGDMSTIDVEYRNISRLGEPWGSCVDDVAALDFKFEGKIYNRISCERSCMNDIVNSRCQCYHTMFLTGTTIPHRQLKVCNTTHKRSDDACFRKILEERDNGVIDCRCPPPCKETTYITSLSAGRVNQDFFDIVRSAKSIKLINNKTLIPRIEDNFEIMGLRVSYKEMFYSTIIEAESYSWQSLVANIGGNMGLFLGLSFVTFLEIFEFFTEFLWSTFIAKKKKKKANKLAPKYHAREAFVSTPKSLLTTLNCKKLSNQPKI